MHTSFLETSKLLKLFFICGDGGRDPSRGVTVKDASFYFALNLIFY